MRARWRRGGPDETGPWPSPSGLGSGAVLDRLEHSGDRFFVADATNGLS